MTVISEQRKIQHLYWRAGFGPLYTILEKGNKLSLKTETEKLFNDSKEFIPLELAYENYPTKQQMVGMSKEEKNKVRRQENQLLIDLNNNWVQRFADDKQSLREKMTFFWSGHFACRVNDIGFANRLNNTIRKHALGNFGELLAAVSKEPAMLQFLNNKLNRKMHPNENFARELMELFTLGRGNYTEQDVKEGARAFTGWGYRGMGAFYFFKNLHDDDSKTFLGKTGNFDGDQALKIILEKKQCAKFITKRIYKFFVNDQPDEKIIDALAQNFYTSGYDIEKLMHTIFTSDWFYDEKNIGIKIKSPIELLAGMMKNFGLKFENEKSILFYQRVLGQVLFQPPNVSGWPGGKNWIDNSTLMVRLMLAKRLLTGAIIDMQPKEESDVQLMAMDKRTYMENLKLLPSVDWAGFLQVMSTIPADNLNNEIVNLFIQADPRKINTNLLDKYNSASEKTEKIKNATVHVLSLPEYQLC
ncbi:MAG: DUF1800 domain-containing protein [Bacteroidia bacterium]